MYGNVRARAALAVGMTMLAVVGLSVRQATATAYSNRCDPGNARYNLLANDPVVSAPLRGVIVEWQNRNPDNSWMCVNATLSLNYVGTNPDDLYAQGAAALESSGWTTYSSTLPDDGWKLYMKPAPDGSTGPNLHAMLRKQAAGIQIDMDEPGGSLLGQMGFSN